MSKWFSRTIALLSAGLLAGACQLPEGGDQTKDSRRPSGVQANALQPDRAPSLQLAQADAAGMELDLAGGRYAVGARERGAQLWSTLGCADCGVTNELGKPRLPVLRRLVEVPLGANPSARLDEVRTRRLSLDELGARHRLLPVQQPVPKRPGALENAPFDIDRELYARDAYYPAEGVSVSAPLYIRGHQLVLVELRPVRYNPARGELELIEQAKLRLDYGPIEPARAQQVARRRSPAFEDWMDGRVIGFEPAPVARGISTDKYAEGILVIAGDAWAADAGLAAYLEDRRDEGHKVELVAMADIGASTAEVRSYVRQQYLAWSEPALSYVLLIGDTDDVPVYTGSGGNNSQVTDLYYASIDPDNYDSDLLAPDLMVSRISVDSQAELDTYLERAGHYIWADWASDTSWLHKASFLASCDNSGITEGTHDYVIGNHTEPLGFTGSYPSDPQAGGDQLYCASGDTSESNIQTHLGHGRVLINFSGHGSETSWADPGFTQGYLSGVTPDDAAPFVVSNACLTGSYGRGGGDCWGEMWLAHSHGAILFWGASNSSYWEEDDIFEKDHWDGVFDGGLTRLADGMRNAKMELLAHYGANGTMEYYFEMYNALGDSTLDLYTAEAFDAAVTHPFEIPVGVDTIDVTVSHGGAALEGALVCARGGVVQQVGRTDAAGHVQLVMDPPPADVGTLQLTVTAHNMRRYVGAVQVVPADGPYLVHRSHLVTSDGSTPVDPNPGRHVVLPITVHNIGTEPATGISASLSSTNPLVTFTQGQPQFDDIAVDADGSSTVHAEFDIDPATPDGEVIDLQLDWSAAGGWAGTTRFALTVVRPQISYTGHTVDDSLAGCDADGFADVDEETTFRVTVANQGSGDASDVAVNLAATGCEVSAAAPIASLPAGAVAEVSFVVTPQFGIDCPALDVEFTVSATAEQLPAADVSHFYETLNADIAGFTYEDDMEGAEPNGWSHGADVGTDDWGYVTDSSHSPSHAWWTSDPPADSDKWLLTPPITIGDTAELRFWQRLDCEDNWDGGRLAVSVDGGAWTDLGPYILQGGYNNTISDWADTPFQGLEVWSDVVDWHEVVADLSDFGPGELQLRFRFTSDGSVGEAGWWIDDFSVDAQTVVCQEQVCTPENRPPQADAGEDQLIENTGGAVQLDGSGSRDPNLDPLDFSWEQTGGSPVSLSDATAVQPTFDPPEQYGEQTFTFELTVFDGEFEDSDSVTITVWGCDDGESCTSDTFTGSGCEHEGLADCTLCGADGVCIGHVCQAGAQGQGVACDDDNACTQSDTCQAGACVGGDPVVCEALDQCHQAGVCNQLTGECSNPTKPDGAMCDDDSACTLIDVCQDGVCTGTEPKTCEALDQCHVAGSCDPATGECSDPPAEDGTACDDGDLCTLTDACQDGACVGGDPVECTPPDACHSSTCDPDSGECQVSEQPDGSACDDGDACTQLDTCQDGICNGSDPVVCEPLDQCHVAGSCDPDSGECSNPAAADGTVCDDGDACTREDTCQAGSCSGADPVVCEPSDECHLAGECDPESGSCSDPLAPDGTECSTGICEDGVCIEESDGSGCGCSTSSPQGAGLALLLLGLLIARRRAG